LLARRAGNRAAAVGVITGVMLIFWMSFSPKWTGALAAFRSPFHPLLIVVVSTLTIFFAGLLASQFTKRVPAHPTAVPPTS